MVSWTSSFDYFSLEGIPWLMGAWLALIFFRPLATLLHESGHLLPTWLLTKGSIQVRIGSDFNHSIQIGRRIELFLSLRNPMEGVTICEDENLKKITQAIILLGGPCFSLGFAAATGWALLSHANPVWLEILMVGMLCAHALAFLRSVVPMRLKATKSYPLGPPSDGLQLIQLLTRRD